MLNFATYNNYSIKLDNVYLFFLEVLACFAILIVLRVRNEKISFLDMQSNLQLRGMAILTLIIGHFSLFCLKERIFFSRFGYLSVMVFLFSSGYGLTVKYNFESINTSFWKNRIIKIFIPFWLVLILFIGLDRELLDISYSWKYIFFNLTGLCPPGKAYDLINASLWYIEYLLLLYLIYYTISHIDTTKHKKLLLFTLFLLTIHSVIIYSAFLFQRKNIWIEYTLVFPLGILLALHRKNVAKFLESTNQSFIKLAFFTFFLLIFFSGQKYFQKTFRYI